MKLRYTDGCTCTSYDVDGTEFIDLTLEKQRELAIKLINYTNNPQVFANIYSFALEDTDELYEMSEEQIKEFYDSLYNKINEFKVLPIEEQKNFCVDYITNYNSSDADWLYQNVFGIVLESDGDYKYLGHCECCGDSIREYTLEI